jgi:probable HAF family extracellular repeat protein
MRLTRGKLSQAAVCNESVTVLDPPQVNPVVRSQAGSLNSQGQVVGTYRDLNNKRHGFLWSRGTFINTAINVPHDDPVGGTVAIGINDLAQIVGDYVDATDHLRHGFLLSQGAYTTLDPPGSSLTVAEAINNAGVIVGVYLDAKLDQHGFLLSNGVYTQIDVPGSTATQINSINPRGQIVGYYNDQTGTHGFVGTPAD